MWQLGDEVEMCTSWEQGERGGYGLVVVVIVVVVVVVDEDDTREGE